MRVFCLSHFLLFAILMAGCTPTAVAPSAPSSQAGPTSEDVLTSALNQLQPENFGINSDVDKATSLLNSWRFKHAEQLGTPAAERGAVDEGHPVAAPPGWIPEGDEARLAQSKFDLGDAIHIRDSILFHTIAGYLSDRGRTEEQRARVVVDFVCRNVALWKDDEIELPLFPFNVLLLGRGNPNDRAWVCSVILRQLRLDSVILRAKSDKKESSDKWLVGVGVEGNIYLYDMHLGLPVNNGEGKSAAKLSEIESHPEWLEQMSTTGKYRLSVDDLRDPAIFVMPDPECWCQRMKTLQMVLPVKDACVLYDPLIETDGNPGMLRRISEAYHWPVDSLKLWPFPQQRAEASKKPTQEIQQESIKLTMPLSVPIPFKVNEDGKIAYGMPERKLERCRIDQLLGQFDDAIKKYLRIRHLGVERFPPELERVNRPAVEDALFWTAICKFELGQYDGAVEQLTELIKSDRKGNWYFPAKSLLAQCHIDLGQIPEATALLERTSTDDPYREANALRLKAIRSKK